MRALIQRVTWGKVNISGKLFNEIKEGFVILLGVWQKDSEKEAEIIADKTVNLRVMSDKTGKMNLSILDTKGEILVISQFTLYADLKTGRRPSFLKSAKPEIAEKLYNHYVDKLKNSGVSKVVTGQFGAYMQVELNNDGPVTIMIDSDDFKLFDT